MAIARGYAPEREPPTLPTMPVATSPRLWPGAEDAGVAMLAVYRRNDTGSFVGLGQIAPDATEADLIVFGRTPGMYEIRVVDYYGTEHSDPRTFPARRIHLAPDHAGFRAMASAATAAAPAAAGGRSEQDLLRFILENHERQRAEDARRMAAEKAEIRQLEASARSQRDLAATVVQEGATATIMQQINAINEIERKRQEAYAEQQRALQAAAEAAQKVQISSLGEGFSAVMAVQMQMQQLQVQQMEAQRARDREDYERKMQAEKLEYDRKAAEDRARYERERDERERREREDREARERRDREDREARELREEREENRKREHEAMLERLRLEAERKRDEIVASKDPIGTVLAAVTAVLPVLKTFGVDPADLKNLISGGAAAAETKGLLATAIETFGGVAQTFIKAQAGGGFEEEEEDEGEEGDDGAPAQITADPVVAVRFADGSTRQMRQSEAEALMRQQTAAPPHPTVPQTLVTPPTPAAAPAPPVQATAPAASPDDKALKQTAARFVEMLETYTVERWPDLIPEFLNGAPNLAQHLVSGAQSVESMMVAQEAKPETTEKLINLLQIAQATGQLPPSIRLKD